MIPKGHMENFETLKVAFENNDVAIMECRDMKTRKIVIVICAVERQENGDMEFKPFAKLFNKNPYTEVTPPSPTGERASIGTMDTSKKNYAIDTTGTYYVYAEDDDEARDFWCNEDFGALENLEINDVRIAE